MNFQGKPKMKETNKVKEYPSITQYMTKFDDLVKFKPDQPISEAIELILDKRISGGPVLDDMNHLVGILSEKDCLEVLMETAYNNMPNSQRTVSQFMTPAPQIHTVDASSDIVDVAQLFLKSYVRRFPVLDGDVMVGQVSRRDILKGTREMEKTTWNEKN